MQERIYWPISLWALLLALDLSVLLAIGVALDDRGLLLATLALLALTCLSWWRTRLIIRIEGETLFVGRAQIDSRFISQVIPLDPCAMRHERGAGLDPRAFLALRYWIKTGVKLILDDPRDPTPYWLVSAREVSKLEELLRRN